jgi:inhibitor of KinA sporulation pathway (predicted exonuclease)
MKLTAFDLELNQPSGKIIQIGAVVGDTLTGEISQRLSIFVNPGEPLAERIGELCGIRQEQLDQGQTLYDAYLEIKKFHTKYSDFINPVTWGGGDSQTLRDQLGEISTAWCFGRRWIDAKTLYASMIIARDDQTPRGGLKDSMKSLGLTFKGREHDALDDAENTFKIYHHMLYLIRHSK